MTAVPSILSPEEAVRRLVDRLDMPARLLVAISGGSDSTGLLVALSKLAPKIAGLTLFAATIDHALRPASAEEAVSVALLCKRLGIRHFIRRWEGEKPTSGISAASREARYRLLGEIADEMDATAILTGHTLDDQAETVAMRSARNDSDGNLGLAGMAEAVLLDRRHWLVRPFLYSRRTDIRDFLTKAGETWIDDPSNLNPRYERVRLRLSTSDAFDQQEQEQAAARRTALSDAAAEFVRDHVSIRHGVLAHIDPAGLSQESAACRHVLSVLAAVLGGRVHLPGSESLGRVAAFLGMGLPGRITAGRVIFDLRRDGLYMMRENRGLLPLHVAPGVTDIWDGRYRITNRSSGEIVVGPVAPDREAAVRLFPDVPPAIAMRAVTAMPSVRQASHQTISEASIQHDKAGPSLSDGGIVHKAKAESFLSFQAAVSSEQGHRVPVSFCGREGEVMPSLNGESFVRLQPVLAPFDGFLPQFDLNLANKIAVLIGCDVFTPPPVKDSGRKR